MIVAVFVACLLVFVGIGAASALRARASAEDYLVAGRSVSPWLTALSSAATNNSGFMFVGLIGFTYRGGLHTVWMAICWILGDLLVWLFVHRRVREVSGEIGAVSVPELLAWRDGGPDRVIAALAGLITFVFLGGYAGAQFEAGAAALHSLFGWDPALGALLGAAIVVIYCVSGGLRASIWTDAAQSVVMLGSMVLLLAASVAVVGGPAALHAELVAIDPALVRWFPEDPSLGFAPYLLGFVAGGFGAVGQPHILVRSMAITSAAAIARARLTYFAWFVPFYAAAVALALYARVIAPELAVPPEALDPEAARLAVVHASERALPELALRLLPDALVGLLLAALFSATMSTADSQLLSCSAAVTQDIAPRFRRSYLAGKVATVSVAALALGVALWATEGVFALVLSAWSLLGAALGPLLLVRLYAAEPPSRARALGMMISGPLAVFAWRATPWAADVFDLLPGLLAPMLVWALWPGTRRGDSASAQEAASEAA